MFTDPLPESVLYCYTIWQPCFFEMERDGVQFHLGIPSEEYIDTFRSKSAHTIIILDDMMEHICKSTDMECLFTKGSHHKQLTIIYLNQNLYMKGKNTRTINLNSHYIVLFRTADVYQIQVLGKQMGMSKTIFEAYQDAMNDNFGYLVLDRSPCAVSDYKIRSKIFPEEDTIIYQAL